MNWSWLDLFFPWIGGVAAVALLVLLFSSNLLRSEPTLSRWHDPSWLSWMAVVAYLLHNVEEYGRDLLGHWHSFPDALCANLKLPGYPDCPIPPTFYVAVNIPLFWIVAPLAALLSRRHPLVGLALYSVVVTNGLMHVMASLMLDQSYNPGLLTAVVVFLPLSTWVGCACFGRDRLSDKAMALLIFGGVLLHVILAGSVIMFVNGLISSPMLVWIQIGNAGLLLLIPWLGEEWRGGVLLRRGRGLAPADSRW
jgi:hypothetical protein